MIWIFWKRPGEGTSTDWRVFDWFKSTLVQLAKRMKLYCLVLARVCVRVCVCVCVPWGLPRWYSGKDTACQCRRHRRHGFQPWVGKIAWRRKWQVHSNILAWRIPWVEEPGRLQSMGLQSTWLSTHVSCYYSNERVKTTLYQEVANMTVFYSTASQKNL